MSSHTGANISRMIIASVASLSRVSSIGLACCNHAAVRVAWSVTNDIGRALFLLILMVTAFLGLSVKEHREAITLWDAKVADLRRQLVAARDELGRLR